MKSKFKIIEFDLISCLKQLHFSYKILVKSELRCVDAIIKFSKEIFVTDIDLLILYK